MNAADNPLCVALDTTDVDTATRLATALQNSVGWIKLGLEFFSRNGHEGVRTVQKASPLPLFLDLKFHDIPNTVAGAVKAVMPLGPAMINCHATGGRTMMRAFLDAAMEEAEKQGIPTPKLIAVTVLTSFSDDDLSSVGCSHSVTDQVRRLAANAFEAGLDGVVCSAREAAVLRRDIGGDFMLVTPGVRPAGTAINDQKRIMTPQEAMAAGASVLVMGRPITGADNPSDAALAILENLKKYTSIDHKG